MTKSKARDGFSRVELERFRGLLLEQQRSLFDELEGVEHDLRVIEEDREAELEERSQEEAAAALLARLEEQGRAELREIHDALARIATGSFGTCMQCGRGISAKRLQVIPAAPLCAACASEAEVERLRGVRERREPPGRPVSSLPPELRDLDDEEIAELVRERLHAETGEALAGLRLSCFGGVVRLDGELPSDELHQVAVQIVEDEMGLTVVTRTRITDLVAEGVAAHEREPLPDDVAEATLARSDESDDAFEAAEEGTGYVPPDRPVPERE